MTFDEMLSFTVDGGKATCELLANGFVHYQFSGWRIGFPGGSGSGISFTDDLKAADWSEYQEPAKPAWADLPAIAAKVPEAPRRGRKPRVSQPLPVNDIGDWQKPPEAVNPWAEIKAKKEGWASYD